MALIELGSGNWQVRKIDDIFQKFLDVQAIAHLESIREAIYIHKKESIQIPFLDELPKELLIQHLRPLYQILDEALRRKQVSIVMDTVTLLFKKHRLSDHRQEKLVCYLIWASSSDRNWDAAGKIYTLLSKGSCYK